MTTLRIAVQPGPKARAGVAIYPPVAARLLSETNIFEELSGIYAVATLVHESGDSLYGRLGGRVSDSAHPLPASTSSSSSNSSSGTDRAYFYFPDLVIPEPGRYCIRVSLMQMDYSSNEAPKGAAVVRDYDDSRWIDVGDRPSATSKPNHKEQRFLRKLEKDGQEIPSSP
ncbi:uncharacterized protein LY89DRAFT_581382 [Mollisia scopiformis]|uniref:Velvet domain-containing protein n=1 Tax=Mollisia scopiformis TaxID=149040 RepID=A0A194XHI0_MOLSC|nr:uncharacterized protein LY89DRAFT_581382 [Mollisia scopiformis]KUJ19232.1 hypothetical protein LY89DRAFT_581382 [Mollisia scopiformis]